MVVSQIKTLLSKKFEEEDYKDLFIVDVVHTTSANKVEVFLDSDSRLTISQCARLNRFLQKFLDEENLLGEKYILDVSSPGVGKPLKLLRQYKKNIGRRLELWLHEGKPITGKLTTVTDEHITV